METKPFFMHFRTAKIKVQFWYFFLPNFHFHIGECAEACCIRNKFCFFSFVQKYKTDILPISVKDMVLIYMLNNSIHNTWCALPDFTFFQFTCMYDFSSFSFFLDTKMYSIHLNSTLYMPHSFPASYPQINFFPNPFITFIFNHFLSTEASSLALFTTFKAV